ncbi:MAG: hypothetical protein KDD28_27075 [Phaeodactylibacter sp.]|nr:hypothetical protein [Phaeodactylibacter sp.]
MAAEQTRLSDRLDEMNKEVRQWGNLTKAQLIRQLMKMGLKEKVALSRSVSRLKIARTAGGDTSLKREEFLIPSLRSGIRKSRGHLDSVWISFERHGIFYERGVGKYRKVGSPEARAAAKPWLSVILPQRIEKLSRLLAEHYADIITAELRILIPGVIDTRINGTKHPEYLDFKDDQGPIRVVIDPSFF